MGRALTRGQRTVHTHRRISILIEGRSGLPPVDRTGLGHAAEGRAGPAGWLAFGPPAPCHLPAVWAVSPSSRTAGERVAERAAIAEEDQQHSKQERTNSDGPPSLFASFFSWVDGVGRPRPAPFKRSPGRSPFRPRRPLPPLAHPCADPERGQAVLGLGCGRGPCFFGFGGGGYRKCLFPFSLLSRFPLRSPPPVLPASEIYLCKTSEQNKSIFPSPLPASPPLSPPSFLFLGGFRTYVLLLRYNNAQRMMKTVDTSPPT